jgi:regulatory protein
MPRITAIERQQKAKEFFSVFVDGSYALSLSEFEMTSLKLAPEQELSVEELASLMERAGESKSYNKAVQYIGVRPRSVAEVRDYLARKGVDGIEPTLERLKANGLLNDVEFASVWIANRLALRPRSSRMLKVELRGKGVSGDDIDEALAACDTDTEIQAAMAVAAKKKRLYVEAGKLQAYLARQGFSYDTIKKALVRLDELDDVI